MRTVCFTIDRDNHLHVNCLDADQRALSFGNKISPGDTKSCLRRVTIRTHSNDEKGKVLYMSKVDTHKTNLGKADCASHKLTIDL